MLTVTLPVPLASAIVLVTTALAAEAFGVVSTLDLQATLQAKLGINMPGYTILGACNPALAQQALGVTPLVGLLLPCNVVIREIGEECEIRFLDPRIMLDLFPQPELVPLADTAQAALLRVAHHFGRTAHDQH